MMSNYQADTYDAGGGYGYYGYGYYGYDDGATFLNASGELGGPGTSAYETSNSPAGYVRTSYAYEGYYGNYYHRDTITGPYSYRVNTSYQYYAGNVLHSNDTMTSLNYPTPGSYDSGYATHGQFEFGYSVSSDNYQTDGAYKNVQISGIEHAYYASGGYTTSIDDLSFSLYNGAGVPGSSHQFIQQSYTDPYGYTTTTQYHNT